MLQSLYQKSIPLYPCPPAGTQSVSEVSPVVPAAGREPKQKISNARIRILSIFAKLITCRMKRKNEPDIELSKEEPLWI